MKRFAAVVLGLLRLSAIYAAGSGEGVLPDDRPAEVVIGFQVIPNGEIIAKDMGWHEESFGVPVRWVQVDSGRDLNTGIASGSIHMGLGGSSTTVAAIAQGVPAEVIWIYDIIGENEALVVREDSDIRTVADLTGKTVAAPFGATTHYHLLAALGRAEVEPSSVTILDLQPPDMLAAWQRGDIDAGFVWEPTLAKMLALGGRVLISSRELAEQGFVTGDIGIVRKDFARNYPRLVSLYLANQDRAVRYYRERPDDAAAAVARQFGVSKEEAARQMAGLVMLSGPEQLDARYLGRPGNIGDLAQIFKDTANFLARQKTIDESPDIHVFRDAINPSYLVRAIEERE
jgi:taurine transport system substrate-binding protein